MSDLVVALIAGAFVLLAGGYGTYQVWRTDVDVSRGVRWAVGETGSAGYQASLLPNTVGFALALLTILTAQVWDTDTMPGGAIPVALGVMCLLAFALSAWLLLFMRPRILVPPKLRGQRGWIAAAWVARRERNAGSR